MLCVFWSVFFKLTLLIQPQTPGLFKRAFPRAIFQNGGADGWREGCLQVGAVTATRRASACRRGTAGSSHRDNAAAGSHTRRCYLQ